MGWKDKGALIASNVCLFNENPARLLMVNENLRAEFNSGLVFLPIVNFSLKQSRKLKIKEKYLSLI